MCSIWPCTGGRETAYSSFSGLLVPSVATGTSVVKVTLSPSVKVTGLASRTMSPKKMKRVKGETNGREIIKGNIPYYIPGQRREQDKSQPFSSGEGKEFCQNSLGKYCCFRFWKQTGHLQQKKLQSYHLVCFPICPMVSLTSRPMLSGITTFLPNLSPGEFIEEHVYLSRCMTCPKYWSQLWFSVWGKRMTQLFRKNNYVNRSKRANGQNVLMN